MTFRFDRRNDRRDERQSAVPPKSDPTIHDGPWNAQISLLPTPVPDGRVQPWPLQFGPTFRRHVMETHGTQWSSSGWTLAPTPFSAYALCASFEHINGRDDRFEEMRAIAQLATTEGPTPTPSDPCALSPLVPPLPAIEPAWPHQVAATHWLDRRLHSPGCGAFLYFGMGTGKTRIALDWIVARDIRRVVVTVPRTALGVWGEEAKRWWPRHFKVWTAGAGDAVRKRWNSLLHSKVLERKDPTIIVVNYDSVWRKPFNQLLMNDWGIDMVIADECHRLKGRSSERSRFFRYLWRHIPYRLALSGTPLSNGALTDAYGQFAFLDPGIFGLSLQRFEEKYAIKRNWQVLSWRNTEDFYRRFWWITRHEDRSVLTLPPLVEVIRDITLPAAARKMYDEMKEDAVVTFRNTTVTAQNALVILSKLQQIASGRLLGPDPGDGTPRPVLPLHDAKRASLIEVLQETGSEPVVVFCVFREDLRQVHEACRTVGLTSLEVSGSRSELESWQRGGATVLAVQIQSGSEGVSMTRASYAVFFSPSHSLAQMEQAKTRLHRPGQASPVTLIHLLAKNTVDVQMHRALRKKINFIDELISSQGKALDD